LIAKAAQDAAYQIAQVFAWRGEKDRAVVLKSLHPDPRFNALLRKLKLPE
jgi:hypothetical protein